MFAFKVTSDEIQNPSEVKITEENSYPSTKKILQIENYKYANT